MCGICGVYSLVGEPADAGLVKRMCDSIRHRGPDDEGMVRMDGLGMGMRRLSIIDLHTGHQPISNEDGSVWIVFNGEIYNYIELRDSLVKKGHKFSTSSDTECIVHLYEDEGIACLERLRGMFAFALYDARRKSLLIARDRLGVKPLFYRIAGKTIAFGSEIKTILETGGVREIDEDALGAFFTFSYIPAPKTIFRGIHKLEPGHYLVCEGGRVEKKKYWDLCFRPDYSRAEGKTADEFMELFATTVGMHMVSDVPVGVFLSGGIDSGLVTAMMGREAGLDARAFTVKFGGKVGGYFDESVYARELAARYGMRHIEESVMPEVAGIMESIVKSFDEPFADDSVVPTYYICRASSREVKVVLTGLGGDEMFAGYDRYLGLKMSGLYAGLPELVRSRFLTPAIMRLKEPSSDRERLSQLKRFVMGAELPPNERYLMYVASMRREAVSSLFSPGVNVSCDWAESVATGYFLDANADETLDRALYMDIKMYLPDDILALSDRLGMRHSLELRVPFVDHKVVEFCATIPASLKLRWGKKKYLLKKASKELLGQGITGHPKQGFASPMTSWIRHDLRDYVTESLRPERLALHGLFDQRRVDSLIDDHIGRRSNNYKVIFSLLMFQKWYENYMVRP